MTYFKLENDNIISVDNVKESSIGQPILKTNISMFGFEALISTVFLGIDHSINIYDDKPILFETMIFCDDIPSEELSYQVRYSDLYKSIEGHNFSILFLYGFLHRYSERLKQQKDT